MQGTGEEGKGEEVEEGRVRGDEGKGGGGVGAMVSF